MKKIKKAKLDLSKETVRVITASELSDAQGGITGLICDNYTAVTCRSYAVCTQMSRQVVGC